MKKWFCMLIIILNILFIASGCKEKVEPSLDVEEVPKYDSFTIKASDQDPRTKDFPTMLREFSFDFDSDKEDEKIELYTAAGRDEKGQMMWDDGQNWLLVVADKDKYYTLFSEYVQLGQIHFSVSYVGEDRIPHISILRETGSSTQMFDYAYNIEKDEFIGGIVYSSIDKNQVYSSIPGY